MIPYFPEPVLRIGPLAFHSFGMLLAAAILLGFHMAVKRGARLGIRQDFTFRAGLSASILICGLAGADFAKWAMDYSPVFLAHPGVVLSSTRGIRSLGAFGGGLIGALLFFRWRRLPGLEMFRILDVIAYVLPFAWMIGRLGCALAHDHIGLPSRSWIAVKFPGGPRYDLGLIEFLFLAVLSALFSWLDRKPRPVGFFFGLYAVTYGGFRIWLDTLHLQPMRFYGGAAGCLIGIAGWMAMARQRRCALSVG